MPSSMVLRGYVTTFAFSIYFPESPKWCDIFVIYFEAKIDDIASLDVYLKTPFRKSGMFRQFLPLFWALTGIADKNLTTRTKKQKHYKNVFYVYI